MSNSRRELKANEPLHEKMYPLTGAPNEDSNQTAQMRSLIRVFVVRLKKTSILGYESALGLLFRCTFPNGSNGLPLENMMLGPTQIGRPLRGLLLYAVLRRSSQFILNL